MSFGQGFAAHIVHAHSVSSHFLLAVPIPEVLMKSDETRNFIFEECNLCFGSLSVEAVVLTIFASMLFWSCNVFSCHKFQCQNSIYQTTEIFI